MEKHIMILSELEEEAGRLITSLAPLESRAALITLSGELGAGKTAFTKAMAHVLGIEETITSPTFVLEKIYLLGGETAKFKRLIHIDAYRLESGKDLIPLGFHDLMQDSGNLIVLEWPERVETALPEPTTKIILIVHEDGSRTLKYG